MNSLQKLATVAVFERIVAPYTDCADSATEMVDSIVRSCISTLKQNYVGKHAIVYTTYTSSPELVSRPLGEKDIDKTYKFLTSPAYLKDVALTADKVSALIKIEEELRIKRSVKTILALERASVPIVKPGQSSDVLRVLHGQPATAPVVSSRACSCLA